MPILSLGRKFEVIESDKQSDLASSDQYSCVISINICCSKVLQWKCFFINGKIDICPMSQFFKKYLHSSPYIKVVGLSIHHSSASSAMAVISEQLATSYQAHCVSSLLKRHSMWLRNDIVSNAIDYISKICDVTCLLENVTEGDNRDLLLLSIEFPMVFLYSDWDYADQHNDYEYFRNTTLKSMAILVSYKIKFANYIQGETSYEYSVNFIYSSWSNRQLDVSKGKIDGILGSGELNDDILFAIKDAVFFQWIQRKRFIEELQKLASIIEYDTIDFTFVTISVRLKKGKMVTLCSVDIKMGTSFPAVKPLVSFHDLTNMQSVAANIMTYDPTWAPERCAREIFTSSCSSISLQAFS